MFKIVLTASDADAENVVVTDTLTGNLQFMGTEHFTVRDSHSQEDHILNDLSLVNRNNILNNLFLLVDFQP